MYKILLTCVGGDLAPQLIRELILNSRHDVEVVGVDNDINAIGKFFCNEFYVVPLGDDPDYCKKISHLVEHHKIDLVIPTSDEEAISLSKSRVMIEKNGCKLACVSSKTLEILTNKAETFFFLKKNGFQVPQTKVIMNFNDLQITVEEMFKELKDVVVKPSSARGGRGVHIISSSFKGKSNFDDRREIHSDLPTFINDLMGDLKNDFPLIVMERLVEPVIDIDLLAWKGKPITVVARKRINSAVPNDGHTIIDDEKLINLGHKLIKSFNLSWLYDCDVMFDSKGNPCILELNPRQSGSLPVSIAAGIPILDDLISLAKGEEITKLELPINEQIIPFKSLAKMNK